MVRGVGNLGEQEEERLGMAWQLSFSEVVASRERKSEELRSSMDIQRSVGGIERTYR